MELVSLAFSHQLVELGTTLQFLNERYVPDGIVMQILVPHFVARLKEYEVKHGRAVFVQLRLFVNE